MVIHSHTLDPDQQLAAELEALVDDYGVAGVAAAVEKSRVGEKMDGRGSIVALRVAQLTLIPVIRGKNARLEAEVRAAATGLIEPENFARIAAKYGISKQAFSKRAVQYIEEAGLPPGPGMKSEKAKRNYANTNSPRMS